MSQVERGDTVWVHYTGRLRDGTVFGTSKGKAPLKFTIGEGEVIEGLESAVLGMTQGESKSVEIGAARAFGPHRKDKVLQVDRSRLPDNLDAEMGQRFWLELGQGKKVQAVVTDASEERLTLDANHPLAGKDLRLELDVVEIA